MKTTCAWLILLVSVIGQNGDGVFTSATALGSDSEEVFDLGKTIEVVKAPGTEAIPVKMETSDTMSSCVFHGAEAGKFPKGIQAGQKFKVTGRWLVSLDIRDTSLTTKDIFYLVHGTTPNDRFRAPRFYSDGLVKEADSFWRKCKKLSSNTRTCAASTKANVLRHFRVAQYVLTDEAGGSVNLSCGTAYRFSQWFPVWGYSVPSLQVLERSLVQK